MAKKKVNAQGLSSSMTTEQVIHSALHAKNHTQSGYGFAAENANALNELLSGNKVNKIGLASPQSGLSSWANGIKIQTKYGPNARSSVNMAFKDNKYKHQGMMLEVPRDQYDQAIEIFKEKICQGKVYDKNGRIITDPNQAEKIISQGTVTYEQARNLAKAGNIESLTFDTINGAVICGEVAGISLVINFACAVWNGANYKEAAKLSIQNAIQAGSLAGITNIAVTQASRNFMTRALTSTFKVGVSTAYKSSTGRAIINKAMEASLGRSFSSGAASISPFSRLFGSNVVTGVITTTLISAPDFYHVLIKKDISWTEFSRNLFSKAASVAGGAGGWIAGAALGTSVMPGSGTLIGGAVGALAGGLVSKFAADKINDCVSSSDATAMQLLVTEALTEQAQAFLLNQMEFKRLSSNIQQQIRAESNFVRNMYGSSRSNAGRKAWFIENYVYQCCLEIAQARKPICTTLKGRCIHTCKKAIRYVVNLKAHLHVA